MSSQTMTLSSTSSQAPRGRRMALWYLVLCEVRKLIRVPMFAISQFVLPTMLFSLFVLPTANDIQNGIDLDKYMMPSFSIYVVMSSGVFATALGISSERSMKWNLLLRATPMKIGNYIQSKFITSYLMGFAGVALLFGFARLVAGIDMSLALWIKLLLTSVGAMTPFIALGFFLGYVAGPQAAAGIANLIVLPLSFTSGIFVPADSLPAFLRDYVVPYSPAYHAGQLGWHLVGAGDSTDIAAHILWLAGYTALFILLGLVWYRRDEGKTYG